VNRDRPTMQKSGGCRRHEAWDSPLNCRHHAVCARCLSLSLKLHVAGKLHGGKSFVHRATDSSQQRHRPPTNAARTLRLGEPPFTLPIAHPCTLRSTLNPSGIWQHIFFELRGDFDGVRRRYPNDLFEYILCCLVRLIDWTLSG
jgi:hypothetical protein